MNNISKCPECGNTLISEELPNHVCKPSFKPKKFIHIYYTHFFTVCNSDGSKSAVAEDKDGTIFLIDHINRKLTGGNINREDNRTPKQYLY